MLFDSLHRVGRKPSESWNVEGGGGGAGRLRRTRLRLNPCFAGNLQGNSAKIASDSSPSTSELHRISGLLVFSLFRRTGNLLNPISETSRTSRDCRGKSREAVERFKAGARFDLCRTQSKWRSHGTGSYPGHAHTESCIYQLSRYELDSNRRCRQLSPSLLSKVAGVAGSNSRRYDCPRVEPTGPRGPVVCSSRQVALMVEGLEGGGMD